MMGGVVGEFMDAIRRHGGPPGPLSAVVGSPVTDPLGRTRIDHEGAAEAVFVEDRDGHAQMGRMRIVETDAEGGFPSLGPADDPNRKSAALVVDPAVAFRRRAGHPPAGGYASTKTRRTPSGSGTSKFSHPIPGLRTWRARPAASRTTTAATGQAARPVVDSSTRSERGPAAPAASK